MYSGNSIDQWCSCLRLHGIETDETFDFPIVDCSHSRVSNLMLRLAVTTLNLPHESQEDMDIHTVYTDIMMIFRQQRGNEPDCDLFRVKEKQS
jgi:hypothetical protein